MRSKKYTEAVEIANGYHGHNPLKKLSYWFDSIKTWQRIAIIVLFLIILTGGNGYAKIQQYMSYIDNRVKDTEVIKEKDLSCVDVKG